MEEEARRLLDTRMIDAEMGRIVNQLWPASDKTKRDGEATPEAARRAQWRELIWDLYRNSPTTEGVRGTRWGGYQAVTEALDHFRPVKVAKGDYLAAQVARAEGALDGPTVRVKDRVWKLFQGDVKRIKRDHARA